MRKKRSSIVPIALVVALGGFLMGFDASVISGVIKFIEPEFGLSKIQLGWSVASLALTATLAMMFAGPISDRFGRRIVLKYAAVLYAISAICSAFAPTFTMLVIARMIGGLGVGISLILAPMYIAEISPAKIRGRMVSFNQLNIVLGISVAFFTNYLILSLGNSDAVWVEKLQINENNWRWMLGLETLPAVLYFFGLLFVPQSPRWLILKGQYDKALKVMKRLGDETTAEQELNDIKSSMHQNVSKERASLKRLFDPSLRLVITIGIVVAILQQITGINSVFFYAPMIFEQSGIGTDASFVQAILVGIINLVFTIAAMLLIDKLGRKFLLVVGVSGIVLCMFLLSYGFSIAEYKLTQEKVNTLPVEIHRDEIAHMIGVEFSNDKEYKNAVADAIGSEAAKQYESDMITAAVDMNPMVILFGILGFVASFAISLGPVMWVLFSELFPNNIRGLAISFVGFINSGISFLVQLLFPWELAVLGSSVTFLIYGVFAIIGLIFIVLKLPETKGKSLEQLEAMLVK